MGQTISPEAPREICRRCRRPKRVCFCDRLARIESQTHVIFIQHPLEAKVGIHSQKTEEFYDLVERLSPGPYLELFARRKRDAWVCLGDEVETNGE